jgi:hypothetical protein
LLPTEPRNVIAGHGLQCAALVVFWMTLKVSG